VIGYLALSHITTSTFKYHTISQEHLASVIVKNFETGYFKARPQE